MSPSVEIASNHASDQNPVLSRAASCNHLPDLSLNEPRRPDFRRTFSDHTAPTQTESSVKEEVAAGKDILRRSSLRSKERPAIAVSRFTVSADDLHDSAEIVPQDEAVKVPETRPPEPAARPSSKSRSMPGRLANFARKPWISNADSRAPSPSARGAKHRSMPSEDDSSTSSQSSSKSVSIGSAPDPDLGVPSRKRSVLYKRPRRPVIAVVAKSQEDNQASPSSPSTHSLQSKTSLENLTSSLHISTPILPARSKAAAASSSLSTNIEPSQKRDELWNAFRVLEADYQK